MCVHQTPSSDLCSFISRARNLGPSQNGCWDIFLPLGLVGFLILVSLSEMYSLPWPAQPWCFPTRFLPRAGSRCGLRRQLLAPGLGSASCPPGACPPDA